MNLYKQVKGLYEFAENPTKRVGIGIPQIDNLIRGPAPGEVCMIMGRSYSGKSIIGQNIINFNRDIPSIFFSMEMPAMQAVIRLYSMWSDTDSTQVQMDIEEGNPPAGIWELPQHFIHHEIVDTPGITVDEMSSEVLRFEDSHGRRPEFVVLDYLELLGGAKASGEGYLATEAQSTMLKDWARAENMRVFVLHQTNRQEKQWQAPTEDSARNAGFTEADFVIGLWRPGKDPNITNPADRIYLKNIIRANVLKNRPFFLEASKIDIRIKPSLEVWRESDSTTNSQPTTASSESESIPSPY